MNIEENIIRIKDIMGLTTQTEIYQNTPIFDLITLKEQPESYMDRKYGIGFDPVTGSPRVPYIVQDPHLVLPVVSLMVSFVPIIGPFLGAAIGLMDAHLYYRDGDNYNAGLSLFFETIPFWGPTLRIGSKILKIDGAFTKNLLNKIIGKKPLNDTERSVFEYYKKNANEMGVRFKNWLGERFSKVKLPETTSTKLIDAGINVVSPTTKVGVEIGKSLGAAEIYNKSYEMITGASFKSAQKWFLSDKSENDNNLMNKALAAGWKPGYSVPEKFQTNLYKQNVENLNKLDYGKLNQYIKQKQT